MAAVEGVSNSAGDGLLEDNVADASSHSLASLAPVPTTAAAQRLRIWRRRLGLGSPAEERWQGGDGVCGVLGFWGVRLGERCLEKMGKDRGHG